MKIELEKDIEEFFRLNVKKLRGKAIKFSDPSEIGASDRLVFMPHGPHYFVELKRPRNGKLSKHQIHYARKMKWNFQMKTYLLHTKERIHQFFHSENKEKFELYHDHL